MKKFLSLLLALTMLLTLCGVASADAGVFTGVGDSEIGGKGAIEVAVTCLLYTSPSPRDA